MSKYLGGAIDIIIPDATDWAQPVFINARKLWADALGSSATPSTEVLEKLATYFCHPALRDRLIIDVVSPLSWTEDECTDIIMGILPDEPDEVRIGRAVDIFTEIIGLGDINWTEAACMTEAVAWFSWIVGGNQRALLLAGKCITRATQPVQVELAQLVLSFMLHGKNPTWPTKDLDMP